jgi:hypothetical protein
MKWVELFDSDCVPSNEDIVTFIGEAKPYLG